MIEFLLLWLCSVALLRSSEALERLRVFDLSHFILQYTCIILILDVHIIDSLLHLMLFYLIHYLWSRLFVNLLLLHFFEGEVLLIIFLKLLLLEFSLVVILSFLPLSVDLLILHLQHILLMVYHHIELPLLISPLKKVFLIFQLLIYCEHSRVSLLFCYVFRHLQLQSQVLASQVNWWGWQSPCWLLQVDWLHLLFNLESLVFMQKLQLIQRHLHLRFLLLSFCFNICLSLHHKILNSLLLLLLLLYHSLKLE